MRNEILAWYAYSESGAAGTATLETREGMPSEQKSVGAATPRMIDAPRLAELFAAARQREAIADAQRWQRFFDRNGFEGLIDLAKSHRSGKPVDQASVKTETKGNRESKADLSTDAAESIRRKSDTRLREAESGDVTQTRLRERKQYGK
jgi:hypothetical protein